jgi:6,7-dimethyl-8-ribityllumazine synthase
MEYGLVTELDTSCDPSSLSVGIVLSEFNGYVVDNLLEGALGVFDEQGVLSDNLVVYRVPGAFEIPGTTREVLDHRQHDGIVCLGAVIRGETPHFDFISSVVSDGIGQLSMEASVPVIFGVLTTNTRNQALHRASQSGHNHGGEVARSLLQTVGLYRAI